METIPSTALIRKVKGGRNQIKIGVLGFLSLVISTFATTWIEQKMFLSGQLTIAQIDSQFIIKFCLLFSSIEFALIILGLIIYKIGLSWVKKKYQRNLLWWHAMCWLHVGWSPAPIYRKIRADCFQVTYPLSLNGKKIQKGRHPAFPIGCRHTTEPYCKPFDTEKCISLPVIPAPI